MKSIAVVILSKEEVERFVSITSQYDFDIDLRSGRHVVDAKSLGGIMSIDLNRPLRVEIYSDEYMSLVEELKDFRTLNKPRESALNYDDEQ